MVCEMRLPVRWKELILCYTGIFLVASPQATSGWSLFSTPRGNTANRIREAQSLLRELKQGKSRFDAGISVVAVGEDECGIQWQDRPHRRRRLGFLKSDRRRRRRRRETDDIVFIDRDDFLTPQSGLETPVGQALRWYLSRPEAALGLHQEKLPHIYLSIYLALYKQGLIASTTGTRRTRRRPNDHSKTNPTTLNYLDTLPALESLEHLPIFWKPDMLEELQCSVVKEAVQTRRNEWNQELIMVQEAMKEAGLPRQFQDSLDPMVWCWARSIITTRAFSDSSNGGNPCLCPYVDMMNHVTDQDGINHNEKGDNDTLHNNEILRCDWEIDSDGYHLRLPQILSASTAHSKSAPQRIEISYGRHGNAHFLMNYGFSILDDDNQATSDEVALLPVLLPDSVCEVDTEVCWEADGLGDCRVVPRNVSVGIGSAGPIESVLSLCRVACTQDRTELSAMKDQFVARGQRIQKDDDVEGNDDEDGLIPQMGATLCRSPFSTANEIRALHMLRTATQSALHRYDTSLEEDTDWLRQGKDYFVAAASATMPNPAAEATDAAYPLQLRNAVTIRRGEKRILTHYYLLAGIGLSFLESSNGDFDSYKGMLQSSLSDPEPLLGLGGVV